VPFTGSAHCGLVIGRFDSTLQHSWPDVQQKVPQQNEPLSLQVWPDGSMQAGGAAHVPLSQKGVLPLHTLPQLPQFWGSL
jgi:hypothetical protein